MTHSLSIVLRCLICPQGDITIPARLNTKHRYNLPHTQKVFISTNLCLFHYMQLAYFKSIQLHYIVHGGFYWRENPSSQHKQCISPQKTNSEKIIFSNNIMLYVQSQLQFTGVWYFFHFLIVFVKTVPQFVLCIHCE